MIIDKSINPERDLYYLGGVLIDILSNKNVKEIDFMDLYALLKKNILSLSIYFH